MYFFLDIMLQCYNITFTCSGKPKNSWLTLLLYSLYGSGVESNPQYLWALSICFLGTNNHSLLCPFKPSVGNSSCCYPWGTSQSLVAFPKPSHAFANSPYANSSSNYPRGVCRPFPAWTLADTAPNFLFPCIHLLIQAPGFLITIIYSLRPHSHCFPKSPCSGQC